MVNIIGLNSVLSRLLTAWTSLETSLGAISRLRTFIDETPQEARPEECSPPPPEWPMTGSIDLNDVTAAYRYDDTKHSAMNKYD